LAPPRAHRGARAPHPDPRPRPQDLRRHDGRGARDALRPGRQQPRGDLHGRNGRSAIDGGRPRPEVPGALTLAAMTSSTFLGHPALRLLIRMKLRGALRSQLRKLHRPSGWLFALLGLSLFGLWIGRFVLLSCAGPQPEHDPEALMLWTKIGLTVVCLMTVLAAFSHRGL